MTGTETTRGIPLPKRGGTDGSNSKKERMDEIDAPSSADDILMFRRKFTGTKKSSLRQRRREQRSEVKSEREINEGGTTEKEKTEGTTMAMMGVGVLRGKLRATSQRLQRRRKRRKVDAAESSVIEKAEKKNKSKKKKPGKVKGQVASEPSTFKSSFAEMADKQQSLAEERNRKRQKKTAPKPDKRQTGIVAVKESKKAKRKLRGGEEDIAAFLIGGCFGVARVCCTAVSTACSPVWADVTMRVSSVTPIKAYTNQRTFY